MVDYISRKAAIEALGKEPERWTDSDAEVAEWLRWKADVTAIKFVPPADVRPVVFCKDCDEVGYDQDGLPFCQVWDVYITESKKNGFCHYGSSIIKGGDPND